MNRYGCSLFVIGSIVLFSLISISIDIGILAGADEGIVAIGFMCWIAASVALLIAITERINQDE